MRTLLALLAVGATGCQLVFDLTIDTPEPAPDCSPASLLVDSFNDDRFGPQWRPTVVGNASLSATAGVIRMTGPTEAPTTLSARNYLQLRGHSFSVKTTFLPGEETQSANVRLELLSQTGETVSLGILGNANAGQPATLLAAKTEGGGGLLEVGSMPYDMEAHRYWRIAHDGFDLTTWEVSPDGTTFDPLFELSGLPWVGFMKAELRYSSPFHPLQAEFDDFNGDIERGGTTCPISQLQDDFSAVDAQGLPVFEPIWASRVASNKCTLTVAEGQMVAAFGPDDSFNDDCTLESSTVYDLRNDTISVELRDHLLEDPLSSAFFGIRTFSGDIAVFQRQGSKLAALAGDSALPLQEVDYNATAHRFLRLSATDDVLVWEVSEGGVDFVPFGAQTQPGVVGPLDAASVLMGIEHDSPPSSFANFDNVNTPP